MVKRTTKRFINGPIPFVDNIRYYLHALNTHPLFIGLMVIMLNIGSKYITIKLSKSQEQYIKNSLGRQFLIFAIMWSGTRDIVYAILLTGAFVVMADHLFNEDSQYCVVPTYLRNYATAVDTNDDGYVTAKEEEEALEILKKLKKQKQKQVYLRYHNA
jgi:hypothetical protein|tara:strand:- start:2714 stop:3187 length:474 start_codon:yes stop_codon:yes gene_type:complete